MKILFYQTIVDFDWDRCLCERNLS